MEKKENDRVVYQERWYTAMAGKKPYTAPKHPGRNEPCSCGSGKKYKHCCIK